MSTTPLSLYNSICQPETELFSTDGLFTSLDATVSFYVKRLREPLAFFCS